jgi:hypothetical protein
VRVGDADVVEGEAHSEVADGGDGLGDARPEVRKTQKPPNPWLGTVVTILDELQGWLSIPPG